MNGAKIFFVLLCAISFKALIIGGEELFVPEFEIFELPTLDFVDVDCDLFDFTCSSVAQATQNIALLLKFVIVLLADIIVYLGQIIVFIALLIIEPMPDAPWFVNIMVIGTPVIMVVLYIISQFRPGADA